MMASAGKLFKALLAAGIVLLAYKIYTYVPDWFVSRGKKLMVQIETGERSLAEFSQVLSRIRKDPERWQVLRDPAQKESWDKRLTELIQALKAERDIVEREIEPVVNGDRIYQSSLNSVLKETETKVRGFNDEIRRLLRRPDLLWKIHETRHEMLGEARRWLADIEQTCRKTIDRYYRRRKANGGSTSLATPPVVLDVYCSARKDQERLLWKFPVSLEAPANPGIARLLYPSKRRTWQEAEEQLIRIVEIRSKADEYLGSVARQVAEDRPDYDLLLSAYEHLSNERNEARMLADSLESQLVQLDELSIKVLIDQRVTFRIRIKRESWCEESGCSGKSDYEYPPINVSEDVYRYFHTQAPQELAFEKDGLMALQIPEKWWRALSLDPHESWPESHTSAVFVAEDLIEHTQHSYARVSNGQVTFSQWEDVSPDYYREHFEHLGMAIDSKPLGWFEAEAIKTAQPPGLVLVEPPVTKAGVVSGENAYGMWRQDDRGRTYWTFRNTYGVLSLLIPGGRYDLDTWVAWVRQGEAELRSRTASQAAQPPIFLPEYYVYRPDFFGDRSQFGTFGRLTYTVPQLRHSAFALANPRLVAAALNGENIGNRPGSGSSWVYTGYPYYISGYGAGGYSVRSAADQYRGRGPGGSGK